MLIVQKTDGIMTPGPCAGAETEKLLYPTDGCVEHVTLYLSGMIDHVIAITNSG